MATPPPMPEHLRAAVERARANPMPHGPERDRLIADAAKVKRGPENWLTTAEFLAELEASRPRAAE